MALTQAEKNELKKELLNAVKAESQSVDELTTVTSLDGVNFLPAIRGTEVVNVPVSLLRKPAEDAAKVAEDAATLAINAASLADIARGDAAAATTKANDAAKIASDAAKEAAAASGELTCGHSGRTSPSDCPGQ